MTRPSLRASIVAAVTLILASGSACLDYTPITDLPTSDAGADASVPADILATPCYRCSAGLDGATPGCGAAYAACQATARCVALFVCGIPLGCYETGRDATTCLAACGISAGVSSADDPAVKPFISLYTCVESTCSTSCKEP